MQGAERTFVKILVQPDEDGTPLIKGIESAKKSVEIVIFRFDRRDIERALKDAVSRGVFVHALIAHVNHGGEELLRKLEMRILDAGGTVARTPNDLSRYHYKMMIIDRRILYLLAFNFTYVDMQRSRSFGVITRNRKLVQEAIKLFEADIRRQSYAPGVATFIVSPANARKQLSAFIKNAKKQLFMYDLRISDRAMIRLLDQRAKAGVDVRIIGRLSAAGTKLSVRRLAGLRLHTRTFIRDRNLAFIGSQSLRKVELDKRREVGVFFHNPEAVARLIKVFEEDWAAAGALEEASTMEQKDAPLKAAKKLAKRVARDLPPVTSALEQAVKEIVGDKVEVDLDSRHIEETVKDAVKDAVKEAIKDVFEEVVEQKNK
jgi:cardiolipin synthase A/B